MHKFIYRSIFYPYFSYSPPFYASDPMKTYNIILRGMDVMEFPKKIGRNPQNLIRRLCRESPTERLGYQKDGLADVKNHKWDVSKFLLAICNQIILLGSIIMRWVVLLSGPRFFKQWVPQCTGQIFYPADKSYQNQFIVHWSRVFPANSPLNTWNKWYGAW